MATARDAFLRRYATSPLHVPRLERMLAAYGDEADEEQFARRFIEWDRACADAEAARIVTEILAVQCDEQGRIVRFDDRAVEGAIRWMAEAAGLTVTERAATLRERLSTARAPASAAFIERLRAPSAGHASAE
jgi:hypothetical protein